MEGREGSPGLAGNCPSSRRNYEMTEGTRRSGESL
jgi:hypothetical protein